MIKRMKQLLNKLGRTFMPHLYDLNPKLKPKAAAPAPKAVKKAPAKKAAKKK
jgi:hypothetical protein